MSQKTPGGDLGTHSLPETVGFLFIHFKCRSVDNRQFLLTSNISFCILQLNGQRLAIECYIQNVFKKIMINISDYPRSQNEENNVMYRQLVSTAVCFVVLCLLLASVTASVSVVLNSNVTDWTPSQFAVEISMPDTVATSGDTVLIPVVVSSDLTGLGVSSSWQ